jgi:hypothetical protein
LRRRLSTPPASGCPTRLEIAPAALAEPSWVPDGLTAVKTYWSKHLLKRQYAALHFGKSSKSRVATSTFNSCIIESSPSESEYELFVQKT